MGHCNTKKKQKRKRVKSNKRKRRRTQKGGYSILGRIGSFFLETFLVLHHHLKQIQTIK